MPYFKPVWYVIALHRYSNIYMFSYTVHKYIPHEKKDCMSDLMLLIP